MVKQTNKQTNKQKNQNRKTQRATLVIRSCRKLVWWGINTISGR